MQESDFVTSNKSNRDHDRSLLVGTEKGVERGGGLLVLDGALWTET